MVEACVYAVHTAFNISHPAQPHGGMLDYIAFQQLLDKNTKIFLNLTSSDHQPYREQGYQSEADGKSTLVGQRIAILGSIGHGGEQR